MAVSSLYPKVNELLFINIDSANEIEASIEYKSRISDIEEQSILMEIPMQESVRRLKRMNVGDELSVYYLNENGVKHYFNTYVLGFKEDVIRMVRIRKPEPETISRIQRRTFLRVNAEVEIAVKLKDTTRFITTTVDISGGGLSFYSVSKYNLTEGDTLSCWVLVHYKNGSVEHVPLNAEIVRIKDQEHHRSIVMLKFMSISDVERQKLIRYCFEKQFDFRDR